ncbi:MAG TPA: preprotein translocase subunit SecE [Candidatus Dormibacteraeota bacterium]
MASEARRRVRTGQAPGFIRFLRETFEELRKVVWPTMPELYRYTLVVVVTVSVIALFVGAVDLGLTQLSTKFLYGKTG